MEPNSIDRIYWDAAQIASPAERQAYLDRACGGDARLRQNVEQLLEIRSQAEGFLEAPAPAPVVTVEQRPVRESSGTVIGPYKLLEQIGEGGMGTVWMAQQIEPVKRVVALKLIKAGMDSKPVIARFEAERQALALMDHPNIAKVLDAGTTNPKSQEPRTKQISKPKPEIHNHASDIDASDLGFVCGLALGSWDLPPGRPYFVMDLVKGMPITKYCDENHLTPRQRLELFIPVCQAVQHAHQKGIIHRDLKPSNVLVALYDGKPVPKVIDFGVAKAAGQPLTEQTLVTGFGAIVGTLEYMSPEQAEINQLDIDTRSDIYSLGVLLYELLTGSPPFSRKELETVGLLETLRMIREEEPSKPSAKLSTAEGLPTLAANRGTDAAKLTRLVRGELDWIVMKALEKDRERRYETANDFAMDLQRYLADEPVQACPPSRAYRLRKFVRRHKGPVLATSIIFLLLLGGIVGTTVGLIRAENERFHALSAEGQALTQRNKAVTEAEKARKAEQEARDSEADTKAFSEFLVTDILWVARPARQRGGLGINVTVRQALQAAQEKIESTFKDRPRAEAVARHALGVTFRLIGEPRQAEPHLRRAVALRQEVLGRDHEDTLQSQNSLAVLLGTLGKHVEATPLLEETLKLRQATLECDHPNTLFSMVNLAINYQAVGKVDRALPLYEEALKLRTTKLGAAHPQTASSMMHLGAGYQAAGQISRALPLYEEALKLLTATLGPEHPDTLESMHALARGYQADKKWGQALPLAEKSFKLHKETLGPDHPDTLASMSLLASCYQTRKFDLALPLAEEALKLQTIKLGADHAATISSMKIVASCYRAGKKPALSAPLYEKALKFEREKLGSDHPVTLATMNNLAMVYQLAGNLQRALPLFQEAAAGAQKRHFIDEHAADFVWTLINCHEKLEQFDQVEFWRRKLVAIAREKDGPESGWYATELALLGVSLLRQKKFADAEPLLRECLAVRGKNWPDQWTTFNAKSLLGASLLGQNKYADAEPLLLQGYRGLKERQAKITPVETRELRVREALERLVQLYENWGKKDKAATWRKELEAAEASKEVGKSK